MNSSALFLTPSSKDAAVIIRGDAAPAGARNPVHLIFTIDISDSMGDTGKLQSVKRSMEFVVPLLTPEDLVSVITFGEHSELILNKVPATEKDTILYKVKALRTDGCTNMSAGLMNINDCLADSPPTARHKAGVLLLTDGHANRGVSTAEGLKQIVQQLLTASPTLTLTTVGYGHDHNIDLLREMATVGAGSYNIVYNLENVATTFGEVLGGLTTVVSQNVVAHFPPGTTLRTGYAVQTDADGVIQVRIGDVYAENEIIILATLPESATDVQITGHNMRTFAAMAARVPVLPAAVPPTIPKNVEQATFRYRVSTLLKEAGALDADKAVAKSKAEALLAELKDLSYADEQLIQMMIDDMETLLESLETPAHTWGGSAAMTSQMAQHSAYLALGRGMRTVSAPMPPPSPMGHMGPVGARVHFFGSAMSSAASVAGDPHDEQTSPMAVPPSATRQRTARVDPQASPFMNAPQRHLTSLMRTSSQHPN